PFPTRRSSDLLQRSSSLAISSEKSSPVPSLKLFSSLILLRSSFSGFSKGSSLTHRNLLYHMHIEKLCKHRAHILAMHNLIKLSMLHIKFCSLKIIRKLLTNRLFNNDTTSESDKCTRFCKIVIP